VRIASIDHTHPLAPRACAAAKHPNIRHHFSPLHDLMGTFGLKPDGMEKRKAVRYEAQWDPGLEVRIWENKEAAMEALRQDEAKYQFFTDGSGKDGGIGASAIYYRDGQYRRTLRYYLGHEDDHEVYEGECVGLVLAMHMLAEIPRPTTVSIWADNTAAITATDSSTSGPAHYLHDMFHTILIRLRRRHPHLRVTISWVPGHTGAEGNERADREAKKASGGLSSPKDQLPPQLHKPLPRSRTAAVRVFRRHLEAQHNRRWKKSPRHCAFQSIDPSDATKASRNYIKLVQNLPRRHVSLLTQLRTGHVPLQKHLHSITKAESNTCPCCRRAPETVFHYLMQLSGDIPVGLFFRLFSPLFLVCLCFLQIPMPCYSLYVYPGTFRNPSINSLLFFQLSSFHLLLYIVSLSRCRSPVYIPVQMLTGKRKTL
jgi:ribonuclease HI